MSQSHELVLKTGQEKVKKFQLCENFQKFTLMQVHSELYEMIVGLTMVPRETANNAYKCETLEG